MATFVDFLFEPPWIYVLMVVGTVVGVWFVLKKYGVLPSGVKEFKGETIKQIIQDQNLRNLLATFGEKVKKGKLVTHMKTIKISRVATVPVEISIRKEVASGRFKKKTTYSFKPYKKHFLVFKSGGGLFESIPGLKLMHKEPEYFVIDDDERFIKKDMTNNIWSINKNTFPHTFGGVWIFSTDGVSFLTELAYKKMQENDKEESVNALKRFIFYNDHFTGRIVGMERKEELKQEGWEKTKQQIN